MKLATDIGPQNCL